MIKNCLQCGKEIQVYKCLEKSKKFCSKKCANISLKGHRRSVKTEIKKREHLSPNTEFKKGQNLGENHPQWKGGRYKIKTGYIWHYAPNHPRAYRKGIYEHILIAEKKLKRYLLPNEVCHHINGIKDDNRPENIVTYRTDKEHFKNHKLTTWSKKYNKCRRCNTTISKHEARGLCNKCYKYLRYHKRL